jgi:hypothetical protein
MEETRTTRITYVAIFLPIPLGLDLRIHRSRVFPGHALSAKTISELAGRTETRMHTNRDINATRLPTLLQLTRPLPMAPMPVILILGVS